MTCRACGSPATLPFIDLGSAPLSNGYLTSESLARPESWHPLRVVVCESCWLVQTRDVIDPRQIFDADYAYFSSTSATWLAHSERFAEAMCERFDLGSASFVLEVAANDGYLLQFFQARGIRCAGVEPAAGTAAAARARGLDMAEGFFGAAVAREMVDRHGPADLIVANNVLAHVPDIGPFSAAFAGALSARGVATFEFPHLLRLVGGTQFDTVYHEHFSYLSLAAVERVFTGGGLRVFDVEEHPTHGGSLRVFAERSDVGRQAVSERVREMRAREAAAGVCSREFYAGFQARAERVKDAFVRFLLDAKREGRRVAGYGAAAKGNTLLNFAGIRGDLMACVADKAASKQGKFLPGSRIPIVAPAALASAPPDYLVIFPWNIAAEVKEQNAALAAAGTRFVTAVPELVVA